MLAAKKVEAGAVPTTKVALDAMGLPKYVCLDWDTPQEDAEEPPSNEPVAPAARVCHPALAACMHCLSVQASKLEYASLVTSANGGKLHDPLLRLPGCAEQEADRRAVCHAPQQAHAVT